MPRPCLCEFIRSELPAILADWTESVRTISVANDLPDSRVIDHLPDLLRYLADFVESVRSDEPVSPVSLEAWPRVHALDRLDAGFDLKSVVAEYALLRRSILSLYARRHGPDIALADVMRLNEAIDAAVQEAVQHYTTQRTRLLSGIDRIATSAPGAQSFTDLLDRMLAVLVESSAAADSASILLLEPDGRLRARAAFGMTSEVDHAFSIAIGEGLTGEAAARREPLFVRDAAADPRLRSEHVRARGIHAFYAVPILFGGELLGVAHMGSRTAYDFSDDDRLLFRTLVNRAAGLIYEHILREEARRRTRELEEEALFRERFLAIVGHDLRNPLQAIVMTVRQLQRAELLPGVERALLRIKRSALYMERMISDLLDVTRARIGGGIPIRPDLVDWRELCREAVDEMTAAVPDREIHLRATGDCTGHWDRDRVRQVVGNLLHNALAHGAAGAPVDMILSCDADTAHLEVRNEGVIPDDVLGALFDPFRKGEGGPGGLGLGLYIVRTIVEAHGGTVEARSEDGTTSFFVVLPRTGFPSERAPRRTGAETFTAH